MSATERSHTPSDILLALVLGAGLVWLLVSLSLPLRYSFQNDSSGYVTEARQFLQGEGIRRAAAWDDIAHEYVATPLFPPGFAIQTAMVSLAGLEPMQAARLSSWLAWALLLPAIMFTVAPLIGRAPALAAGTLVTVSPGLYEWAYPALSDSSALLYSILSLGVLLHAFRRTRQPIPLILLSGLLAGTAYAIRNAALVVPLAVAATYGLLWLLGLRSFREALKEGLWWGVGFLLVAALVLGRNQLVFGAIQPYLEHHGGGDFGLLRAFRLVLWSQLLDLSGWHRVAELAWDAKALLITLPPVLVLLAWLGRQRWRALVPAEQATLLLLLLYSLIGFAMVVWGRSRFDWVEVNLTRHMMAYSWSFLVLMWWPLRATRQGMQSAVGRTAMGICMALVLAMLLWGRVRFIQDDLGREAAVRHAGAQTKDLAELAARVPDLVLTNYIKYQLSRDEVLQAYLENLPDQPYLLSNYAAVLSLETRLSIRNLALNTQTLAALKGLSARLEPRSLLLILVPTNRMVRSGGAVSWQDQVLQELTVTHQVELRRPDFLLVRIP